jgi:hypothetical protein
MIYIHTAHPLQLKVTVVFATVHTSPPAKSNLKLSVTKFCERYI